MEETKKVGRYAANEHEQRLRLQDQLEELAQQHSKLERVAYRSAHVNSDASEPRKFYEILLIFVEIKIAIVFFRLTRYICFGQED